MELNDWSDMRMFDGDMSISDKATQDGNTAETKKSDGKEDANESEGKEDAETVKDLSSYEINDWNDLRKFDDDHDDDWFKVQEKKLAEQYGGTFIKLKYCSNGRVAYFCDLCLAECNAKKSLELHCSGMKHLKKKDMWEKEGKPPTLSEDNEQNSSRDSSLPPGDRKGSRGSRAGFGFNSYNNKDDRKFDGYGKGRGFNKFVREDPYSEDPFRKSFAPPPPPPTAAQDYREPRRDYSSERMQDSYARDYGHGRGRGGYGDSYDDMRASPVRPRYYGDSVPERDSRSKGRSRYGSSRSRSRERDDRRSPDNFDLRRTLHTKATKRSPDSRRSPYRTPAAPSPPRLGSLSQEPDKVNLVASPAGNLLQKLAECCVKSSEDADLALNVVAALTKSLKEYSQKKNEMKIAELLMEAELKVGTVKALKVGMKMLSNFAGSSTSFTKSDDFFNTLTESANLMKPDPRPSNSGGAMNYSSNRQGWGESSYYK